MPPVSLARMPRQDYSCSLAHLLAGHPGPCRSHSAPFGERGAQPHPHTPRSPQLGIHVTQLLRSPFFTSLACLLVCRNCTKTVPPSRGDLGLNKIPRGQWRGGGVADAAAPQQAAAASLCQQEMTPTEPSVRPHDCEDLP